MKKFISLLILGTTSIILSGCVGGVSTPSDDDNISMVKLRDLRLGYEVKGLVTDDVALDSRYDLGFCNDELTLKIEFDDSLDIDDKYGEGTYEIIGENILYYFGAVTIDTGDSGSFEEGKKYIIEQPIDNLTWRIGSISKKECIVEPI